MTIEESVRTFLSEYRIPIVRETSKGEFNARCPLPDHLDMKSSFSISKDSGLWNCFGCGRKGHFVGLVKYVEGVSWEVAEFLAKKKYGYENNYLNQTSFDFPEYETINNKNEAYVSLSAKYSLFSHDIPDYYTFRGFNNQDWDIWEGRFDAEDSLMVFPVKNMHNQIIGLTGRNIQSDSFFRYKNYSGGDPKSTLYGIHLSQRKKDLIVCEGLLDTQRIRRLLSEEADVVGLLSAEYSKTQFNLLRRWDRISIWLDNDSDGIRCSKQLAKHLSDEGKIVYTVPYLADCKDQACIGYTDRALIRSFEIREAYFKLSLF